jgi:predicted HAD superfamily Cof-like phosphohydrolase
MSKQQLVTEFMLMAKQPVRTIPTFLDAREAFERMRLIGEETAELATAFYARDMVEIADALADLLYVVYGTAVSCGINLNPIFQEVHRSNMTKKGGHLNHHGKFVKPATYEPPKILEILEKQNGERL